MKKIVLFVAVLLCFTACVSYLQAATDEEIEQAITDGLQWLAAQQNPDGSWGGGYFVGITGLAVKKFEHYAVQDSINPLDPTYLYHLQVKKGLDYIFSRAQTISIGVQPAGNPDSDGDGIGVYFGDDPTYETGIALMAIAESWCRDSVVNVPGSAVDGWTYRDVAVDVMDYLAFGQNDGGNERGGWGYIHNYVGWSDNSNTGYAVLGLAYGQAPPPQGFGIPVPAFVKSELSFWITYIQCNAGDPGHNASQDGGSGYGGPCDWVNTLKTGNLLFEMALVGISGGVNRDRALAYLIRHWNDPNEDPGWQNHYQAMFCIMKGFEFQGIMGTIPSSAIDWYEDLSDHIVATQNGDGSWGPDPWSGKIAATAWALLTLEKAAPPPPIPTLTEWGLIIFGVVLLGFITWAFLRKRREALISYQ